MNKLFISTIAISLTFLLTASVNAAPKVTQVEIVGPSMLPVDVVNTVKIVGPMFLPKEIVETMVSANGQPGMIDNAQVIHEIVVLPSPNESAAVACRVHVSLGGVAIAHASWNGDEYGSFPLSLPGSIDVDAQMEFMAQLTSLPPGGDGKCSADLVLIGTLIQPK